MAIPTRFYTQTPCPTGQGAGIISGRINPADYLTDEPWPELRAKFKKVWGVVFEQVFSSTSASVNIKVNDDMAEIALTTWASGGDAPTAPIFFQATGEI